MFVSDADFVALAKAMRCDPYALSNTEKLAISTVLLVEKERQLKNSTYLSHSKLSCCDVVIFAAFVIRFFCINGAKNRKDAVDFSDKYVSMIRAGGNHLYRRQPPSFSDMFSSRTAFYDRLLSGPGEMDDKFNNLVDEFTQIILTDFGSDTFTVFDEHSPYVIMDIFNEFDCRLEVNNFLNTLPDTIDFSFQRIQKNLREGRPADDPTAASAAPSPQPQSPQGKHEPAKKTTPAPSPAPRPRADTRKAPNQYKNIQPELKKEYDHINFTSSSHKAPAQTKVQRVPFPYGFVITLVLLIAVAVVGSLSDTSSSGSQEQTVSDTFVQPTHTLNPEYEYIPVSETEMEPVDVSNGEQFEFPRDEQLAPFEVSAPQSANCYVRLHSFRRPYNDVSFYVSQGSTYEILVPLGTYYLYYATGETWYGDDAPDNMVFGEDTTWSRSEDVFEFTDDGEYYNGYTITLYAVPNGNLDTDYVSTEDIPF